MAVFKCKMCGGELNLIEDTTVCECEYCGTTQTVPSADNEKKMNLFNRANRLRFANEFDKAAGVFESIVAEFPEEAEAYWGLVLCKYGIEYVDDPATAKKVPTCHRTSYDGIFEDDNFQMALEYADAIANRVYREEAKEIDRLQKAILEVAEKEEPFDVFICYKETAEDGQRTKDSVLAQDMYDALTAKGYKVFFSRITLEDKLGQEYEPYIFAALNSARVMLAVGTKYEYFNAVWVKNEWSRFLELIKKDKSKVLIPCYCDIDAYDMPLEFKNLQGQDMSKVGFIQDLVRGVEKIIPLKKEPEKADAQVVQVASGPNVASLLERAEMFLEDKAWNSAKEYCEKVLDIDPKNAKAFLYRACAENEQRTLKDLVKLDEKFEDSDSIKKAYRFADDNLKQVLDIIRLEVKAEKEDRRIKFAQKAQALKHIMENFNSSNIALIACGNNHTIGLREDGSVVATGSNEGGRCNVSKWTSIVSVACGNNHTVGLMANGNVVAVGCKNLDQCHISGWTDIVAVACGDESTVGLMAYGGVETTDSFRCNVSGWTGIKAVACGNNHIVGLRVDGRVVAAGFNHSGQCSVSSWTDIVSVACGYDHTIGLKADGRVVATGKNEYGQCNVSGWTDIVAVACGESHTVGLKADGSVVATGKNEYGRCSVSGWTDIVEVACGQSHTVGLRADGSVVAKGNNEKGQCNVEKWKLFDDENQLRKMIEKRTTYIEEARKQEEAQRKLAAERRSCNVCQHCGGEFKGMLIKKCTQCGKGKDY